MAVRICADCGGDLIAGGHRPDCPFRLKEKMPESMRLRVDKSLNGIGGVIGGMIPEGLCFALMVFEQGGPGGLASYVSNADRADMVKALREMADNLEQGLDSH